MLSFLNIAAWLLLVLTLPGTLYLAVLTLVSLLPSARLSWRQASPGRLAIVVPAHNEASGISRTLANLLRLASEDGQTDVIVVADNCADATPYLAKQAGARVLIRQDEQCRGKGYALHHAFTTLAPLNYLAYVVIDADTLADDNFLPTVRQHLAAGEVALQSRYVALHAGGSQHARMAEIALAAFNVVRPRGRARLGLSAGLLGNGFVLHQSVLQQIPYVAGSVVEDLEYHFKLVNAGLAVCYMDETAVRSEMPHGRQGRQAQHARWEGGRLRMLLDHGPQLLANALHGQWRSMEPLLDLLLLPLGYHALLLMAALSLAQAYQLAGELHVSTAVWVSMASFSVLVAHVLAAVHQGRLPWRNLWVLTKLPAYLLWKLTMIGPTLLSARRHSAWVRTNRHGS